MLYGNPTWISDIDKVIEVVPELDRLAGKSLMITGAAGLVCSAIVDIIFRYNDTHDEKIQVLAAGRRSLPQADGLRKCPPDSVIR